MPVRRTRRATVMLWPAAFAPSDMSFATQMQPDEIVLCHVCANSKGIDVSKATSFRVVASGKL